MIRFFRSAFPVQYIVIVLTGLILWVRAFFDPIPMAVPVGFVPLYSLAYSLLSKLPELASLLGFLLTVLSVFSLNLLVTGNDILQKNSTLNGFIFMILLSFHPLMLTLNPGNISIFFLLLILNQLFLSYGREESYDLVFSAGFFSAIGSFFYFPLIFFFGFILFSFVFVRAANWREWVAAFLGVVAPFMFLALFYFWNDQLLMKWQDYTLEIQPLSAVNLSTYPFFIVSAGSIALLSLYTFLKGFRRTTERTIEIRRKALLVNWILFFALGSLLFSSGFFIYHVEVFFIPFSTLITIYLINLKKFSWQQVIIYLFLAMILFNNLLFRIN
jgi:hypothetical protein